MKDPFYPFRLTKAKDIFGHFLGLGKAEPRLALFQECINWGKLWFFEKVSTQEIMRKLDDNRRCFRIGLIQFPAMRLIRTNQYEIAIAEIVQTIADIALSFATDNISKLVLRMIVIGSQKCLMAKGPNQE